MKNRTLCNSDTIFLLLFSIMISIQKVYVLYMVHKLLALILIFHVSCIYISVTNFALLLILVFVVQSVGQVPINCSPPGSFFLWDFPRKNTEVGCHFLFQEIFSTQGLNLGVLQCRLTLYHLSHQGSHGYISEVTNISPSNFDSSLCSIQPSILHNELCIFLH